MKGIFIWGLSVGLIQYFVQSQDMVTVVSHTVGLGFFILVIMTNSTQ